MAAQEGPTRTAPADDLEVEWQFDAVDLRPVERWLASLPLRTPAPDGTAPTTTAQAKPSRRLVDRYLDTEDWRLHRAGLVLRVRQRGRHEEATLKDIRPISAGGLRTRLEVTEGLPDNDVTRLGTSGPVGWRIHAVAGNRPLREVLVVRTRRRPFSVRIGGEEAAEVVLDDTTIGRQGQQPAHLIRVEVEMTGRTVDDVEPLVDEMRDACGLRPATLSKFETGLLALGIHIPGAPDLGPLTVSQTSTIGELAFAVLRRQLAVLLAHEPGTRLGEDIEELHDMRVATRRLRAALDLFADVVPPRGAALRDELAWLGGVLGHVRDLDVQLERMGEMEGWTGPWFADQGDGSAPLAELRTLLEVERERARQRMLEALDSTRWNRLVQHLTSLARQGPNRRQASARVPAALVVPDLVETRHRAVAKAARRAKRSGIPADFHRLRIRCKRLRYSLEFTSGIYGGRTERFTRRLARLQDSLGTMQDAEVATQRLRDLAIRSDPPLSPVTVFAMGAVAEHYRTEAEELLHEMPRHLKVLSGTSWRELADYMERTRRRATGWLPAGPPVRTTAPVPIATPEPSGAEMQQLGTNRAVPAVPEATTRANGHAARPEVATAGEGTLAGTRESASMPSDRESTTHPDSETAEEA